MTVSELAEGHVPPVPPRAMVLGASGFLGRWMARTLTSAGSDLICVSRHTHHDEMLRWGIRGRVIAQDLANVVVVRALLLREAPDVVFNLAGYGVDRSERDEATANQINTTLPLALAEACALLPTTPWTGARLVHVGSALEYGVTGDVLREDSPAQPTTLYGTTKLAGTVAVARVSHRTGLRACTARLFTVFGPGEHAGRLFPTLAAAAAHHDPIPLSSGLQTRDFAFAGDVTERLLHLSARPVRPGEVVNVASGVMHTVRAFAIEAARALQINRDRLHFGAVPARPDEMSHTGVSVARLVDLTGPPLTSELSVALARATHAARAIGWRPV